MDRAIPVMNRILERKRNEHNNLMLEKNLKSIKCSIDHKKPGTFGILKHNLKKQQLKEERITEIERENRILLEKLTTIMKDQKPFVAVPKETRSRSLNKEFRKRELLKITFENQGILRRIQEQKPCYNHFEWAQNHKQTEHYLKNISQYPFQLHSTKNSSFRQEDTLNEASFDVIIINPSTTELTHINYLIPDEFYERKQTQIIRYRQEKKYRGS